MRRLGIGLIAVYLLVLSFLSLNPWVLPDSAPAVGRVPWDAIDHVVAYGGLCLLFLVALKRPPIRFGTALAIILATGLIGMLLEVSQHTFTATRTFSLIDATANLFGALMGAVLYWLSRAFIRVPQRRIAGSRSLT